MTERWGVRGALSAAAGQLAGPALLGNLLLAANFAWHRRAIPRLAPAGASATAGGTWPIVTAVVPARDEAATLQLAVDSLLAQDYPNLHLVLVDDRSTDGTGRIMAQVAAAAPGRVRVLTVAHLPAGWLGKNHALWLGAQHAVGDWLLFADADVVFDPTCLRAAVAYAEAAGLDHLTIFPDYGPRGYWLRVFVAFFLFVFVASQRPYQASRANSRGGTGLGAFNLIRRGAYEAIGTHAAIALRPDDDVRLGMAVKAAGLRQGVLNGADLLRVEWYPSLRAALVGLDKSLFAGLDYRPARVAASVAGLALLGLCPYVLVWWAPGRARWLLLGAIGLHTGNVAAANRQVGGRPGAALLALPLAAPLFCYALTRSCVRTLRAGGIRWRGTFYPLAQLRAPAGAKSWR